MEAKNALDAASAQKQAASQIKQPEKDQVLHTEHNQPQIGGPAV